MKTVLPAALAFLVATPILGQGADPVAAAAAALGANGLKSIHYSGWGSDYMFGQGLRRRVTLASIQPSAHDRGHRLHLELLSR